MEEVRHGKLPRKGDDQESWERVEDPVEEIGESGDEGSSSSHEEEKDDEEDAMRIRSLGAAALSIAANEFSRHPSRWRTQKMALREDGRTR